MMKEYTTKKDDLSQILSRKYGESLDVTQTVLEIIQNVQARKDEALFEYTAKFDQVDLKQLKVSQEELSAAYQEVSDELLSVMKLAWQRILDFHQKQKREGFVSTKNGEVMGQRILPLAKVGVYVPGGTASYPSTVLMDVAPAKVAGVKEIVLITPPNKEGKVNPAVLVAADIAGVNQIFKVGGAHGVAALAYGTQTIPRVDKIVGPGNIYVATAKRLVYGQVDIDMIAGPSDVLIIADQSANPKWLAADLLAQAEHDALAQAVLVTDDEKLLQQVKQEVIQQLEKLPRKEIAQKSLENNGKLILVQDLQEACQIANKIAPEHLEIAVEQPFDYLGLIQNAGSIFLGHYTPEVLGDYLAGPNHTLPTEGTARFYSALSVDDFVKRSSYLYFSKAHFAELNQQVQIFAQAERLHGHANSAKVREE